MKNYRIAIIGNGGGGKTTLARAVSTRLGLPLYHVDRAQFLAGMKIRPADETRRELAAWAAEPQWIIDGFGPIDSIEGRFKLANVILFVEFPLWRHYLWATKRQIKALWKTREELPDGCSEAGLARTWNLYKVLWRVHRLILPALKEILEKNDLGKKVIWIRTLGDWNRAAKGIFESETQT